MKTLAVCGCSFMTTSYFEYITFRGSDWPLYTAEHLPEPILNELHRIAPEYYHNQNFVDFFIMEKKFNYVNLANPGSSNFKIRLQIEHALKFNPDYMIIAASGPDRVDLNFKYFDYKLLTRNYDTRRPNILTNIQSKFNLLMENCPTNSEDTNSKNEALKQYYAMLYNAEQLETVSYFYLQSGLDLLEKRNIPYVFIPGPMKDMDWSDRSIVWPKLKYSPWDTHLGRDDKKLNHNPYAAQLDYLETLNRITNHWN